VSSRRDKVDRRLVVILAALIASVIGIAAGFAVAVHVDDTASVGSVPAVRAGLRGVFIAVDPSTPNVYMDALSTSPVVVRKGCVLFGQDGHLSLPIWPKGFRANRDTTGDVVIKSPSGGVVAHEGQPLRMGGGYVAEFRPAGKVEPKAAQVSRVEDALGFQIPEECLSEIDGIWQVGQIEGTTA
jgi:hypothetical protein